VQVSSQAPQQLYTTRACCCPCLRAMGWACELLSLVHDDSVCPVLSSWLVPPVAPVTVGGVGHRDRPGVTLTVLPTFAQHPSQHHPLVPGQQAASASGSADSVASDWSEASPPNHPQQVFGGRGGRRRSTPGPTLAGWSVYRDCLGRIKHMY
jgi:hypothetical protein